MADKDFCVCDLGLECVYHGILHPRAAAPTPVEPPQGDCMGCHFADMKHRSDCPNRPAIPAEPERDHRFVTLPAPTFLGTEEHGYSTGGTSSSPAKPAESQGVERAQPVEPKESGPEWKHEFGCTAAGKVGHSPDCCCAAIAAARPVEGPRDTTWDRTKVFQCRCGVTAMPLTDDTVCKCKDIYEQEWNLVDVCQCKEPSFTTPRGNCFNCQRAARPTAPVEGVERVTDDAKQGEPTHHHFARVPAHTYLGTEEQGYSTGGTDMYRSITQPAKHTDDKETLLKSSRVKETDENLTQNAADDRPAETIPDKLKQQLADMTLERDAYKQANLTNAETIILLQKRKYCRHEKVSQGTLADEGYMVVCDDCGEDLTPAAKSREPGRAETRIEVLEAALREAASALAATGCRTKGAKEAYRLVRAALAAPSGEQP